MARAKVLIAAWLPAGMFDRLAAALANFDFLDGRDPDAVDGHLADAAIVYGLPPVPRLDEAKALRWVQLISAGVPPELCAPCRGRDITVTNLAGLYGPTIAEHALALMLMLARRLPLVIRQQDQKLWQRDLANHMADLHGKTLAVVGLGNIGRHIARLARAFGMRVVGCRRTTRHVPEVDRLYSSSERCAMLAEADFLAVAAPLTPHTEKMLSQAEFAALKPGAFYVNVSRGAVADEQALLEALRSGRLAGAGLDAYAVEPLPADHPFWTMPQVIVSPHYSGETVNLSALPCERFARNLRNWRAGQPLEGMVDLELGY